MSVVAINEDLAAAQTSPEFYEEHNSHKLQLLAPRNKSRQRLFYGLVAFVGGVIILALQMGLSILNMQSSYELQALNQEKNMVAWEAQMVYDEVAGLSSPQFLAANATALGMVINDAPSYLRLSDGAIIGSANGAVESSSVNVFNSGSVANNLIAQTPLVTDPGVTIGGAKLTDPLLSDPTVSVSYVEGGLSVPVTR